MSAKDDYPELWRISHGEHVLDLGAAVEQMQEALREIDRLRPSTPDEVNDQGTT
jgi:hypothetical protein